MRRLTLPLCLLVLGACGQTRANTQIVASIDADPGVRSRAETLRVIVYGPPYDALGLPITMVRDTPFDMDTFAWPIVVALAPEGRDATRRYRIEAIAQDASGQPVATVRAISGYVPEQTLTLPLRLLDRCIGVTCEDPGQTCFGPDDCRDATIDPQTLVDAGVDDMDGGTSDMDGAVACVDAMCDDGLACTVDSCGTDGTCQHVARDSMCDDDNVCTDDTCTASEGDGCAHTPNAVACDDGIYCNGIDECAAGSCGHPGNPCRGSTVCDEVLGACVNCGGDGDCPGVTMTLDSCTFSAQCSEAGTRTRTTLSYTCIATVCMQSSVEDNVGCSRDTEMMFCDDGQACTDMEMCRSGVCTGGIPTCPSDAGVDAGHDAGHDAGFDAGRDAGFDAGRDAGYDAGRDSGPEGGPIVGDAMVAMELEASVAVPD